MIWRQGRGLPFIIAGGEVRGNGTNTRGYPDHGRRRATGSSTRNERLRVLQGASGVSGGGPDGGGYVAERAGWIDLVLLDSAGPWQRAGFLIILSS